MNDHRSLVPLSKLLRLDLDRVAIDASETYPMVGILSFGRGLFRREAVPGHGTSYKFFYRLRPGQVVLSQLFGWEGAVAFCPEEFSGMFVSPQFPTFCSDSNVVDSKFLAILLNRRVLWEQLERKAKGMGDRRRTVSASAFLECLVPLPPLSEQVRIATFSIGLASLLGEAEVELKRIASIHSALIEKELQSLRSPS